MISVLHKSVLPVSRVVSEEKTYRSPDKSIHEAVRKVPLNTVSLLPTCSMGNENSLRVASKGCKVASEIRVRPSPSIVSSGLESAGQRLADKARSSTGSSPVKRPIGSTVITLSSLPLHSSCLSNPKALGNICDVSNVITNEVAAPCLRPLPSDLELATFHPSSFIQFDSDGDEDW